MYAIRVYRKPRKDTPVFLEPRFYKAELKKYNVFKATYDEKMYNKLAIAIIKPGLGTIRDCLSRGITIFTYTRGSNKEFYYNARTLEKNYLGINFFYLTSAIQFAYSMVKQKKFLKEKFYLAKKLKWNGESMMYGEDWVGDTSGTKPNSDVDITCQYDSEKDGVSTYFSHTWY